jgi:ribosome-associated protein
LPRGTRWRRRDEKGSQIRMTQIPEGNRIELAEGVWVMRSQIRFTFARSGGPGGQNVNKVSTKAELHVPPDVIEGLTPPARARLEGALSNHRSAEGDYLIVCDAERSQDANRRLCLERLRLFVQQARIIPKIRRKTKPSRGSKTKRLDSKRAHSEKKQRRSKDFE